MSRGQGPGQGRGLATLKQKELVHQRIRTSWYRGGLYTVSQFRKKWLQVLDVTNSEGQPQCKYSKLFLEP